MPKIGPDGTFPLGERVNASDQGGLYAGFEVIKALDMAALHFGTPVTWFCALPDEMRVMAQMIRSKCIAAFGHRVYDKSQLPIRVITNPAKGVIELHLPKPAAILTANPEMWLALAEEIDGKIAAMTV